MINSYNKLKLEFNSIYSIIDSYTSGSIICSLDGLKESIESCNKDNILYYLEKINKWYESNISEIQSNSYVKKSELREHLDTKEFLKNIYSELETFDFSEVKLKSLTNSAKHEDIKKIFLSHKSSDKKYANALEKFIVGLGVKNNQLIYTSHPLHKIPLGKKIYDYLRENINDQVFMIILFSNEYLDSPACLSEMGAAWVMQTDYIGVYCPDFSFSNPKYHEVPIDTTKMGAILNGDASCKSSMIELKNKIQNFFGLEDDEQKSSYLIDEFIEGIQ